MTEGKLKAPKNGKTRKVDLSDAAIAALQSHRARLQAELLKKKLDDDDKQPKELSEWMFPNSEGKPHSMTNVRNRIFHRALQKAGLHRRPLHALRHTFATLLLHDGVSPVKVQEMMGHHSITVTVNVYKHRIPSANREAVNRLPSLAAIPSLAVAGD
jgi:integrase